MLQVAIVGAGELGGAMAHALARRDVTRSIRLIDETGRIAEGKALDISQAAPIEGFAAEITGSTDLWCAGGANVVVIADRVGGAEWQGEEGLRLMERLVRVAPSAVLLCAGASQRDLVDRGVQELHVDRRRLFGSAPEALAGAGRAIVALAVDGSPGDVALSVLGVPPAGIVIPWEDVTVAGFAVSRVIDETTRRRLGRQIVAMWPPGPYAMASAAARVIEVLVGRSRASVSCFVTLEDAGRRTRTAALPVRLGPGGIVRVALPPLNVGDQIALDNAILL
jgi:malate dehydrogenase